MTNDLSVFETAALQFVNRALEFAFRLTTEKRRRKFPVRVDRQLFGDLTASALTLFVFELTFERFENGVAEVAHIFETAERGEEFVVDFRKFEFLNFLDFELRGDFFAAEVFVRSVGREGQRRFANVARFRAFHQLVEIGDRTVVERKGRTNAERFVFGFRNRFAFVFERQFDDDVIAGGRGVFGRDETTVVRLNAFDGGVDVFGGEFANRFFELEALPVRNVERRTNFDVVFVNERAFFRKNDRANVEVRFANRGHIGVFVRLGQAVDEERALDAFFDVGLEAFFDQFARSFTGAETRNRGVFLEFGVFEFETFFNVFARNFDFDVAFAGAFFFDVDFERQFFGVFKRFEIFHFYRPYRLNWLRRRQRPPRPTRNATKGSGDRPKKERGLLRVDDAYKVSESSRTSKKKRKTSKTPTFPRSLNRRQRKRR